VLTHRLTFGSRINTEQNAVARAQQSLRAARLMSNQDIRLAGLDPWVSFRFGFKEATPTKFRVTADFDGDRVVDDSGAERVTYLIQAGVRRWTRFSTRAPPARSPPLSWTESTPTPQALFT
jgi:hypothetical protein